MTINLTKRDILLLKDSVNNLSFDLEETFKIIKSYIDPNFLSNFDCLSGHLARLYLKNDITKAKKAVLNKIIGENNDI